MRSNYTKPERDTALDLDELPEQGDFDRLIDADGGVPPPKRIVKKPRSKRRYEEIRDSDEDSDSGEEDVKLEKYKKVKRQFEKENFSCNTLCYNFDPVEKKWIAYNKTDFRTLHLHVRCGEVNDKGVTKNKCFFDKWIESPTKRRYNAVRCLPPPMPVPAGVFNSWPGLPLEGVPACTPEEIAEFSAYFPVIMTLIEAVGQDEPEPTKFVLDWIAHIIQKPGRKTERVLWIKTDKGGAGKGHFYKLLRALLGSQHCHKTANAQATGGLGGTFTKPLQSLLYCYDEPKLEHQAAIRDIIKSMATEDTFELREMHRDTVEIPSYVNIMNTTNHNIPVPPGDMRRPVLIEMTRRLQGDAAYFDRLNELLVNERFLKFVFDWFKQRDISNVRIQSQPMETAFYKRMLTNSSSPEVDFFIDYGFDQGGFADALTGKALNEVQVQSSDLVEAYNEFLKKTKPGFKPVSAKQFHSRYVILKAAELEGVTHLPQATSGPYRGRSVYVFDVPALRSYLVANHHISEDKIVEPRRLAGPSVPFTALYKPGHVETEFDMTA